MDIPLFVFLDIFGNASAPVIFVSSVVVSTLQHFPLHACPLREFKISVLWLG